MWHRIPLHKNLRFVGTINYDETTKPLSQRLRDRGRAMLADGERSTGRVLWEGAAQGGAQAAGRAGNRTVGGRVG